MVAVLEAVEIYLLFAAIAAAEKKSAANTAQVNKPATHQ